MGGPRSRSRLHSVWHSHDRRARFDRAISGAKRRRRDGGTQASLGPQRELHRRAGHGHDKSWGVACAGPGLGARGGSCQGTNAGHSAGPAQQSMRSCWQIGGDVPGGARLAALLERREPRAMSREALWLAVLLRLQSPDTSCLLPDTSSLLMEVPQLAARLRVPPHVVSSLNAASEQFGYWMYSEAK